MQSSSQFVYTRHPSGSSKGGALCDLEKPNHCYVATKYTHVQVKAGDMGPD